MEIKAIGLPVGNINFPAHQCRSHKSRASKDDIRESLAKKIKDIPVSFILQLRHLCRLEQLKALLTLVFPVVDKTRSCHCHLLCSPDLPVINGRREQDGDMFHSRRSEYPGSE